MGPLRGVKVIEIVGIGPGPFCGMVLSDMGAEVLRVVRTTSVGVDRSRNPATDVLARGRRSIAIDLKHPRGAETLLRLVERADVLTEGFRPGVAERLGIGPDACLVRNPRLVYARMTGWGQNGPIARSAGHDINYIALAGVLHAIGRNGQAPVPPLNLVGDFGGGGLLLAFGIVCALLERSQSGQGQVIDAAMIDGAALLMAAVHGARHAGSWREERGSNTLDSGAPYYDTYETADGKYVAIGSLEPQFYAELLRLTGLEGELVLDRGNRNVWPGLRDRMAAVFLTKTREEWCAIMEGSDVCFAPVLSMSEAYVHPQNVARNTFIEVAGVMQPAPAPRFSRSVPEVSRPPAHPGQHTEEALHDWGLSQTDIRSLHSAGAIAKGDYVDIA
jgi:alpha-methylacyl-CoA racemase